METEYRGRIWRWLPWLAVPTCLALLAALALTRSPSWAGGAASGHDQVDPSTLGVGAGEPAAETADLPRAALLSDGDAKTYLLVFRTGQEVMKGLRAFARKHQLTAGHLTGIGAVRDAVIGYFDPQTKTYLRHREEGQAEVLSLTGNLSLVEGEPFFHVHVALGRRDGSARGGHLFAATVRPTVELVLTTYPKSVRRKVDPEWGLPLLAP
jgi:predicted DNA-binding protein with PD1-like motif